MKLLTATRVDQGRVPGDFCHAVEGELVLLGVVCATDLRDPGAGCGCGRAFTGMSSHRATTTAMVRELDLTLDDLRLAVTDHWTAGGIGPAVIGRAEFDEVVDETVDDVVHFARFFWDGVVLGRTLDHVVRRVPVG